MNKRLYSFSKAGVIVALALHTKGITSYDEERHRGFADSVFYELVGLVEYWRGLPVNAHRKTRRLLTEEETYLDDLIFRLQNHEVFFTLRTSIGFHTRPVYEFSKARWAPHYVESVLENPTYQQFLNRYSSVYDLDVLFAAMDSPITVPNVVGRLSDEVE